MRSADRLAYASLAVAVTAMLALSPRVPNDHAADIWVRDYALRFFATFPPQPGTTTLPEGIERLAADRYTIQFKSTAKDADGAPHATHFRILLSIAEHGQPPRKNNPRGYAVTDFTVEPLRR